MNVIKIELPKELKQAEIHVFADEHIGDEHSDLKRVLQRIEYVKNTPNAYCILNGKHYRHGHLYSFPYAFAYGYEAGIPSRRYVQFDGDAG